MLITGREKICAEIAEALGIKHCNSLDIHMHVDEAVTVTAKFYPELVQMEQVNLILKNYNIELIEIE